MDPKLERGHKLVKVVMSSLGVKQNGSPITYVISNPWEVLRNISILIVGIVSCSGFISGLLKAPREIKEIRQDIITLQADTQTLNTKLDTILGIIKR